MIEIRAPRPEDVAPLTAVTNLPGVRAGTLRFPFTGEEFTRQRLLDPAANVKPLVACWDGTPVGQGSLILNGGRQRHSGGLFLFVHDAFWGRGIGRALLEALIDLADNWHGLTRLQLEVATHNARAIRMYEAAGFVIEGTLRGDTITAGRLDDSHVMGRIKPAPERGAMTMFSLRSPETRDIPALLELINCPAVRYGTARLPHTPEAWVAERVPTRAGIHSVVAVVEGIARGWASLVEGEGRKAHSGTCSVSVHDDFQRRGLGRAMLGAILDIADRWLGLRRTSLMVNADNMAAIQLYRDAGFEVEARLRAHVLRDGELVDSLTMARLQPGLERTTP